MSTIVFVGMIVLSCIKDNEIRGLKNQVQMRDDRIDELLSALDGQLFMQATSNGRISAGTIVYYDRESDSMKPADPSRFDKG
jgi:hypothetical protein